jgi:hypothetical protein
MICQEYALLNSYFFAPYSFMNRAFAVEEYPGGIRTDFDFEDRYNTTKTKGRTI